MQAIVASGKADAADSETVNMIEHGFTTLQAASDCKSLLKKHLTEAVMEKLKSKKTKLGATLWDVIRSGKQYYSLLEGKSSLRVFLILRYFRYFITTLLSKFFSLRFLAYFIILAHFFSFVQVSRTWTVLLACTLLTPKLTRCSKICSIQSSKSTMDSNPQTVNRHEISAKEMSEISSISIPKTTTFCRHVFDAVVLSLATHSTRV